MTINLSTKKIKSFQKKIFSWWDDNIRDFPWRETEDPFKIMVSEIMLQQTQAPRVVEKFSKFIHKFPNFQSLAEASKTELLTVWSGLGYNRRALWLQEAAKKISKDNRFPITVEELESFKGIGSYTARSILIFAFNMNIPTVDTNIRRILISEGFATEDDSEKALLEIAEKLLPEGRSRDWHNALMDYGSKVLTVRSTGIKPSSSQSKFKESDRQYRGLILNFLLKKERVSYEELISKFAISEERLNKILQKMCSDELIQQKDGFYQIG